jgi:hypothetical protein
MISIKVRVIATDEVLEVVGHMNRNRQQMWTCIDTFGQYRTLNANALELLSAWQDKPIRVDCLPVRRKR